ncbi:SsrA-binding protein SmpB [Patescibacteria group bacterium]|nr:SsrA-binding protein SmpB [Patescibacteria group bacterium]
MPTLAINKRALFDFEIKDKYEAGIVLKGYEVKSIKTGHISLKGSFVTLKINTDNPNKLPELYLVNAHIPLYKFAGIVKSYDPTRSRKLLIHKLEINRLIGKKKTEGLTLVPLKVYTKKRLIKLQFGIGKGKKKYDKREDIKKKDIEKTMRTLTKSKLRD